jgi:hypothetical protein
VLLLIVGVVFVVVARDVQVTLFEGECYYLTKEFTLRSFLDFERKLIPVLHDEVEELSFLVVSLHQLTVLLDAEIFGTGGMIVYCLLDFFFI